MNDIIQQITDLQKFKDEYADLEAKYLEMFKLSGYEMNIEHVADDESSTSRPKTILELLQEALDNPPTEVGKWIRISDIPRYVSDYLIVPDRETLETWSGAKVHPGAIMPATMADVPVEPEEPERTVNDRGELDPDFKKTGQQWVKAGKVPTGTTIVDAIGVMWHKKAPNTWFDVSGDPIAAMEPYEDRDLTPMGPLEEVEER